MKITVEITPEELLKILKPQKTEDEKNNITWNNIAGMCKEAEEMFKTFIESLDDPANYKPEYVPRKK